MVRKVHKYADGGKVVKSETDSDYVYPKPSFTQAVKDRAKSLLGSGIAKKGADQVPGRQKQLDKKIDSMDH